MAHRGEITGRKPRATADRAPVPPACFSIKTFCLAHHISESMFHKLRAAGLGPQVMQVGNRVLITFESASAWRAEREAATAAMPPVLNERKRKAPSTEVRS